MAPIEDWWLNAVWSVTPTALFGLLFWFVFRSVFHADRRERNTYAQIEAEERERRAREARRRADTTHRDRSDDTDSNEEKK